MSTLSYSKMNSFQNSRLSTTTSVESFGLRRSNTMLAAFPATFSSNNLSGLSQINTDVLKPLRIERIDRSSGSIKWISSSSNDNDHMKIIPNDIHLSKNRDDISNVNGVRMFGKNVIMTGNERRKTNQNNLEDKLLAIKIKELERQSSNLQQQIKRERYKLLDQFIDSKAQNLNFIKKRLSLSNDVRDIDLNTVLKSIEDQTKMKFTSNVNTPKPTELKPKISENRPLMKPRTSLGLVSNSSERDSDDKLLLNPYLNIQAFYKPNENFMSNVTARFIEQKSKYFPSYLKQAKKQKISISSTEIDHALAKAANLNQNRICSKHKQHRLAQIKADLYKSSKELLRDDASVVGNDLINSAEAALALQTTEKEKEKSTVTVLSKRTESVSPDEDIDIFL